MEENELNTQLQEWFKINNQNFNQLHFLKRNLVAKTLKEELHKLNHWKRKTPPRKNKSLNSKFGNKTNLKQFQQPPEIINSLNNKSEIRNIDLPLLDESDKIVFKYIPPEITNKDW